MFNRVKEQANAKLAVLANKVDERMAKVDEKMDQLTQRASKAAAKALKNPQRAHRVRTLLREIAVSPAPTLKTLLTTGPDFEDLNLDRTQDLGRVSEW